MDPAKKIQDYATLGKYPFPSDKIDPKLKLSKDYARMYGEAMLSEFAGNRCEIPFDFGSNRTYAEMRKYAQGRQGADKTKENFFGKQNKTQDGYYNTKINVSWDGMDVMPKMFDVMRGINQKIEFRPQIRCVDPDSIAAKAAEKSYLKFLVKNETAELLRRAKYKPNTPVNMQDLGLQTESDIDLYYDSGAHVTQREIKAEAVCGRTKIESDYKTLQDMHFDDSITLSIIGVKNYIDRGNNVVKQRYVDPDHAVIPYSKYPDFRNINRAGEVRTMTIGELREEYPHIEDKQWAILAKKYSYLNPGYSREDAYNGFFDIDSRRTEMSTYGLNALGDIKLKVFDYQWLSLDVEKYIWNDKEGDGRKFYKDVDHTFELTDRQKSKGDEVRSRRVVKKYFGSLIVGTDVMLDYGLCEDIVYYGPDGNKIPKLDYFFAKTGNQSLVERCISHIDDINLAVVKRRNALATIPPAPRMIIQQQLLDNVFLNGVRQEPEDLINTLIERGYLIVNNLDDFNKPIFQNAKAIDFIPNGVLQDIALFTNEIKEGIERIREVTGLNQAIDGSTPEQYTGLGKTQIAVNASNNALFPTFNIYNSLCTRSFDDVVKKWQIVAKKAKDLKVTHAPLGVSTMEILSLDPEFSNSDYNMKVVMEYTEDQRQMLLQQIGQFNQQNGATGGNFGLDYAEYMYIYDMIMAGNFRMAMYMIAQAERKKKLAARQKEIEDQQTNIQNQIQSSKSAEIEKRKTLAGIETQQRFTKRIAENEQRKTKLMDGIANAHASADGSGMPNTELLERYIEQTNQEIMQLQAQALQAEMQLTEQEMAGDPQQPGAGMDPNQQNAA